MSAPAPITEEALERACRQVGFEPEQWQLEMMLRASTGERMVLRPARRGGRRLMLAALERAIRDQEDPSA